MVDEIILINERKKRVFCILHGLPRTVRTALPLFMQRVIDCDKNRTHNYQYIFVVHTQGLDDELREFFFEKLHKPDKNCFLKNIFDVHCDPAVVKNSNDAYHFRLYDVLNREEQEGNNYDIYLNCRLDAAPNTELVLEYFQDNLTIICGNGVRTCIVHHRDWDYLTVGHALSYKLFHYLIINTAFLEWKSLVQRKDLWPKLSSSLFLADKSGWINGLHPGSAVPISDHLRLEELTGMRTDSQSLLFDNVIKNVFENGGKFYFSDAHTQIYSSLIRENGFVKAL
jgi:hypothetical protein